MVFSRSFEYDIRKTAEFNENFSRSFDFDFQLSEKYNKNLLGRYGKASMAFASLTGVSPNYLTKKEKSDAVSATTVFPKVIPGNKVKMSNPNYFNPNHGSLDDNIARRQQYPNRSGLASNYRSLETSSNSINNRLNSCDSGARSGNINVHYFIMHIKLTFALFSRRFLKWWSRRRRWWWGAIVIARIELQISCVSWANAEEQSKHYENIAESAASNAATTTATVQENTINDTRNKFRWLRLTDSQSKFEKTTIIDAGKETYYAWIAVQGIKAGYLTDVADVEAELRITKQYTGASDEEIRRRSSVEKFIELKWTRSRW
jgi:hypothetical protein